MFRGNSYRRDVRTIATPVVSFVLLAVIVVGAVIFGNLVDERADGCRPFGTAGENDSPSLITFSEDHDELMLCDVPQETVAYVSPELERPPILAKYPTYLLQPVYDMEDLYMSSAKVKGSELTGNTGQYPLERRFSYEGIFRGTPVYVKGEYGSLEDCVIFDDLYVSDYESDDFEGFDGGDMFHPDRIQSCWIELEIITETSE